ncbi:MAG: NTP transferase domain-containing protein [Gemmatimonadaceae bacterium]|nr:NTP transferase domain-containing protein [Gemmatimonadaceae bacterium]
MSEVRRAIIPCGGKGTRMLSISRGTAKELVLIAGEPVLAHVLRECALSGIEHVLVVVSPDKQSVIDFTKRVAGCAGMPGRIETAVQSAARGLADAVRVGRDFAGDEPVAVALPDNLFVDAPAPAVAQVIETFVHDRTNVVGLTEITHEIAATRGPTPIYPGVRSDDDFIIESIPAKGAHGSTFSLGDARSAMTGVGRYVFLPTAFGVIDEVERSLAAGKELDDIPVMQMMLARGALRGRVLHGTFLDVGLPEGFREATERLTGRAAEISQY